MKYNLFKFIKWKDTALNHKANFKYKYKPFIKFTKRTKKSHLTNYFQANINDCENTSKLYLWKDLLNQCLLLLLKIKLRESTTNSWCIEEIFCKHFKHHSKKTNKQKRSHHFLLNQNINSFSSSQLT